jgi:predicted DNA-binding ribbon-helix-helix protein
MKSGILKRSIVIAGHKTSISLEEPFWICIKEIAAGQLISISELVAEIDKKRDHGNLSSAIRQFTLTHYQQQSVIQANAE